MDARYYDPERLVALRRQTGLTQEQVAQKVGKKRQNVCKAENGQDVSYEFVCDLAMFYGVPVTTIIYPIPKVA